MPILALLLAAQPVVSNCHPSRLRLSLSDRDGAFNGMSHSGIEVSVRNTGPDCTIAAFPKITLLDARGHRLPALSRPSDSVNPARKSETVRIAAGHRGSIELRWVSGAVYSHSRSVRAAKIAIRIGGSTLRTPIRAVLFGNAGKPVMFDQTALRAAEGMAAH